MSRFSTVLELGLSHSGRLTGCYATVSHWVELAGHTEKRVKEIWPPLKNHGSVFFKTYANYLNGSYRRTKGQGP